MKVELTKNTVTITLEGLERIWACKIDPIVIDCDYIQEISLDEPELDWKTIRAPGTSLPTYFHAGTFYSNLGKEFWYFKVKQPKLTLYLSGGTHKRIIIAPDNIDELYQKLSSLNKDSVLEQ